MKVLHLLPTNKFSGAENVVCQIMSMFEANSRYTMTYASPEGPIREALAERRLVYHGLKCFSVDEIRRVVKDVAPDVIHAHDMKATVLAAASLCGVPIISQIHNNAPENRHLSLKSLAYCLASPMVKKIIWVSDSAADDFYFKRAVRSKSEIVHNVINEREVRIRAESDYAQYSYDICYIGRLCEPKNPERLVRVLRLVLDRAPEARVAIVGDGDMKDMTVKLVNDYNLNDSIFFVGFMDNPLKLLKSSKVMLMTSLWEGLPMSVLEAQALGVPIVSTPTDGVRTVIKDGINGYLSQSDETLADSILSILKDPQLYAALSAGSLEFSRQFNDIIQYRQRLESIYESVV